MIFEYVLHLTFIILAIALLLSLYRFLIGPDITDRVIALDLIAMIIASMTLSYMIYYDEPVYMDAIVILALITFFGTVAFARYLEKQVTE
jgi:multicomponent Na+:H+ antiporter subunit F